VGVGVLGCEVVVGCGVELRSVSITCCERANVGGEGSIGGEGLGDEGVFPIA
jgi:hypothetical protein